jgi:hypothetical protein
VIWTAALAVAAAGFVFRLPQPADYHDFADQRTIFGVPHFTNVVTNAAFAVVGVIALAGLSRRRRGAEPGLFWPPETFLFRIFYASSIGVAAGSALYHWSPSNLTLFWDRLPMAVCVAALAAGLLAGRLGAAAGTRAFRVLGPAIPATLVYWLWSETHGSGNIWPYLCWMYGTLMVTALVLLLYEPRYTESAHEWAALFLFAGAMLFDTLLDGWLYALGGFMGGHALKHLLAAFGMFWLWWFSLRTRTAGGESTDAR